MTEHYANAPSSPLAAAITSGATTLTVVSATGFPSVGNFRLRIDAEVLLVTAVSGTTFTATRGGEGTTPAGHKKGTLTRHVLTAAALTNLLTVEEADGTPSVEGVRRLKVSNGTLTDDGSGVVSLNTGGGGTTIGGLYPSEDHGVVSDGSTDDLTALQALIDLVSAAGGGIVRLKAHATTEVSGPLLYKSNVWIDIPAGSVLETRAGGDFSSTSSILSTPGALDFSVTVVTNIGLTGGGTIRDGHAGDLMGAYLQAAHGVTVAGRLTFDGVYLGVNFEACRDASLADYDHTGYGGAFGTNAVFVSDSAHVTVERVVRHDMAANSGAFGPVSNSQYVLFVACADRSMTGSPGGITTDSSCDHVYEVDCELPAGNYAAGTHNGELVPDLGQASVTTRTGAGTLNKSEVIVRGDASGGAVSLNLPAATAVPTGKTYRVKKIDASVDAVTLYPNGADTIDGAASLALATQYEHTSIASDGVSEWMVV